MSAKQVERVSGLFHVEPTRHPPEGSVAISHRFVTDKGGRRHSTGRWYKLRTVDDGRSIFRVLTFDPTLAGGTNPEGAGEQPAELAIDWGGWLELIDHADETASPRQIEFTRARPWHFPRIAITHPDPVSRVALKVAAVAFVLGVIPFVVSLVGWVSDMFC